MRRAHGQISAVVVSDPPAGGVGAWKDELIQRNEKLCVVKLHTRTSHSILPRAVRPSRDWRGGRWEIPGDQVVERGALPARFFHVCPIAGWHVPLALERKSANKSLAY